MDEWDIEKAVGEIIEAKIAEAREVEFEQLRRAFEPIAMMLSTYTITLQIHGFSRMEAIGLALELIKTGELGGKRNGK